jgi:hypothetical protein
LSPIRHNYASEMLFSQSRRAFDQEGLQALLRKLRAAREILERAQGYWSARERGRLNAARSALERAIAIAESHVD